MYNHLTNRKGNHHSLTTPQKGRTPPVRPFPFYIILISNKKTRKYRVFLLIFVLGKYAQPVEAPTLVYLKAKVISASTQTFPSTFPTP